MKIELFNDNFQNFKRYGIPKAQLVIADIPYNLGNNAYASNPMWYVGGDNKNGESKKAGKALVSGVHIKEYIEVTYNGDKQETYIDVYNKAFNTCMKDDAEPVEG